MALPILALVLPLLGSGCAALDSRHISFTATSAYLQVSETEQDNVVFQGNPAAYTFAPIGFVSVLALDLLLYPVTFIHDLVVILRGDPEGPTVLGSYAYNYRTTIRSLIAVR